MWWLLLAAVGLGGAWLLMGVRRSQPAAAPAAHSAGVVEPGVVTLPWSQRIKAWFVPRRRKVKGPNIFQRIRLKWLGSEAAYGLRTRREARRVQRRIRDRRPR